MTSPVSLPIFPATLWILVVSSNSSSVIGGIIDGSRFASMVLPAPGGPIIIMFALVNYPEIPYPEFHAFREMYDPYHDLLPAHITFIFPLTETVGLKPVTNHIEKVLSERESFPACFDRLMKTPDHWLLWAASEGNEEMIGLHDELYTGILAPHLREDLPYTPHIGLGLFSQEAYDFHHPAAALTLDDEKYGKARAEFESYGLQLRCTIKTLTLLRVNDSFTRCDHLQEFNL